jgi:hypothetical protein
MGMRWGHKLTQQHIRVWSVSRPCSCQQGCIFVKHISLRRVHTPHLMLYTYLLFSTMSRTSMTPSSMRSRKAS